MLATPCCFWPPRQSATPSFKGIPTTTVLTTQGILQHRFVTHSFFRCGGILAVYRVCWASTVFHALLALGTYGVNSSSEWRAGIQNGYEYLLTLECGKADFYLLNTTDSGVSPNFTYCTTCLLWSVERLNFNYFTTTAATFTTILLLILWSLGRVPSVLLPTLESGMADFYLLYYYYSIIWDC